MEKLTYDVLPKELYEYWNQDKTECKKGDNENIINTDVDTKSKKISIKDKLTTAYALNLCTVSVSRIINCKDQYVMDQEYDAILNNLNILPCPPFLVGKVFSTIGSSGSSKKLTNPYFSLFTLDNSWS